MDDEFLKPNEVCEMLGISPSCLENYRKRGFLKAYQYRKFMHKKYKREDVLKFKIERDGE